LKTAKLEAERYCKHTIPLKVYDFVAKFENKQTLGRQQLKWLSCHNLLMSCHNVNFFSVTVVTLILRY